jgi:hypothetical protein
MKLRLYGEAMYMTRFKIWATDMQMLDGTHQGHREITNINAPQICYSRGF